MFFIFKIIFQKKAIDSKTTLRFLATGISNRCFNLYKDINTKKAFPASKFEGLKGLAEKDAFTCLKMLSASNLEREDWKNFFTLCQEKQTKPKQVKYIFDQC